MTPAHLSPLANILREAVALYQALSYENLAEAQHRARLIVTLAEIHHLTEVLDAIHELETRLSGCSLKMSR